MIEATSKNVGRDKSASGEPESRRVASSCPRIFLLCSRLFSSRSRVAALVLVVAIVCTLAGCFESEKGEPYYGRVETPRAQEFRWSDGGLPHVFDPALAAAPPDTDVVRALFEGLTDNDPASLEPVAAVATKWEASADYRSWTFHLRRGARWSNGDEVTAKDFVRSWQRTLRLGERAPHVKLLGNIEGAQSAVALVAEPTGNEDEDGSSQATDETRAQATPPSTPSNRPAPPASSNATTGSEKSLPADAATFGAQAVGDYVLKVRLKRPDVNFPSLVAHPVFRPVHEVAGGSEASASGGDDGAQSEGATRDIVSNGAFRLSGRAADSVLLERASNYWDAGAVALERVRFVASRDGEAALNAYRNGEVDAVTNAAFEPLALKLLAPYKDFRRATYGALTYYSFNLARAPFDDVRVREALAIALDRDRLCADTMGGATEPAKRFLPKYKEQTKTSPRDGGDAGESSGGDAPAGAETKGGTGAASDDLQSGDSKSKGSETRGAGDVRQDVRGERVRPLEADAERARQLLAEAGFPNGANFPRIRLLVNRNDQHRVMAQAVAAMWRNVLGIETEVVVRSWDEYEAALWTGDYDIARRSIVMQTLDEESNMRAMFAREREQSDAAEALKTNGAEAAASPAVARVEQDGQGATATAEASKSTPAPILSEAQALRELPAIPVYFASSYALVKPYVRGFEANLLDVPSLKHVRLDTDWKPPAETEVIRVVSNR